MDDGSTDATAGAARAGGAELLGIGSPGENSGKGAALLAGLSAVRRDPRVEALLLADADLGASAVELQTLLGAISAESPAAVAAFPKATGGGFGFIKRLSRQIIARRTGYSPAEPLSGQRALLTTALDALPGIAPGFGAEVGMTLDLLAAGIRPAEIPMALNHRPTGRTISGFAHRARQGRDILRALYGIRLPWPDAPPTRPR